MRKNWKPCPRCAERVKAAAQVCRFCGHEFVQDTVSLAKDSPESPSVTEGDARRRRNLMILIGMLAIAALVGYLLSPTVSTPGTPAVARQQVVAAPLRQEPAYEALPIGKDIEWSADTMPGETIRQAGPYVVRISARSEDDLVAPVVTVSYRDQTITMTGQAVSGSYTHRISGFQNMRGYPPAIMLQSFSGGAHCCNTIQVAQISSGKLEVVDLGSWDGDDIPVPTDISGDGIADFVMRDQAFLYAFAPYAMSYAPPQILNVLEGRTKDVSANPAFKGLFRNEERNAGGSCRGGEDGAVRNGACASYVAASARTGTLDQAWAQMLRFYAADQDWEYPTGCLNSTKGECPPRLLLVYKSYPEALLAFLRKQGYVGSDWSPPETFSQPESPIPDYSSDS